MRTVGYNELQSMMETVGRKYGRDLYDCKQSVLSLILRLHILFIYFYLFIRFDFQIKIIIVKIYDS